MPSKSTKRELKIENFRTSIDTKEIVRGITLTIRPGEIHATRAPASGRPSLALSKAEWGRPCIRYITLSLRGVPMPYRDDVAIQRCVGGVTPVSPVLFFKSAIIPLLSVALVLSKAESEIPMQSGSSSS